MKFIYIFLVALMVGGCSARAAKGDRGAEPAAVRDTVLRPAATPDTVGYWRWGRRVEMLLAGGSKVLASKGKEQMILFYARSFIGTHYVAHTLDRSSEEQLVVNLDELDCTTYMENVAALSLCTLRDRLTYSDFRSMLRQLRYRGGHLGYEQRLHYYEWWAEDNDSMGLVKQVDSDPPFSGRQTLQTSYMTAHASAYDMLRSRPDRVKALRRLERQTNGRVVRFIPKSRIDNSRLMRQTVHDGDIIAITTNKRGLDTTHLGIAVWHKDGLHLLNASALQKNGHQVVEPQETLRHYLDARSWNPGIRVARIL